MVPQNALYTFINILSACVPATCLFCYCLLLQFTVIKCDCCMCQLCHTNCAMCSGSLKIPSHFQSATAVSPTRKFARASMDSIRKKCDMADSFEIPTLGSCKTYLMLIRSSAVARLALWMRKTLQCAENNWNALHFFHRAKIETRAEKKER